MKVDYKDEHLKKLYLLRINSKNMFTHKSKKKHTSEIILKSSKVMLLKHGDIELGITESFTHQTKMIISFFF